MRIVKLLVTPLAAACLLLGQPGDASAGPVVFLTSFDYPGGGNSTLPRAISNTGNVVGSYLDSGNVRRGFERFSNGAFSAPIINPNDNGNFTLAFSSNSSGTIVGEYLRVTGANQQFHGFFLNGGNFTDYLFPGPFSTALTGINDAGNAVGLFGSTVSPNQSFFLPNGGSATPFTVPGSVETDALAINNLNQVVGQYIDGSNVTHGFFRDANGSITGIDVPGATLTAATGINDQGWISGLYRDGMNLTHGFLLMNGQFITVDFPGGANTRVFGINDAGFLVGDYLDSPTDTLRHGFIAQVVPEPSALVLLGAGSAGLGIRRVIRKNRKRCPRTPSSCWPARRARGRRPAPRSPG
jgi:hypothetical protein